MAAFVYEGLLLFGVVFFAGLVYGGLTQQHNAMVGRLGLMVVLFVVLGAYFVWFWTRGGQTVATLAWHVRLVDTVGHPVKPLRATLRYLLAWMWFLPALLTIWRADLHGGGVVFATLVAGVLSYAALALLRRDRQFWHDAVCGTRLITWRPARPTRSAQAQSSA